MGAFNLFRMDVDGEGSPTEHTEKTMKYIIRFDSEAGEPYYFEEIWIPMTSPGFQCATASWS